MNLIHTQQQEDKKQKAHTQNQQIIEPFRYNNFFKLLLKTTAESNGIIPQKKIRNINSKMDRNIIKSCYSSVVIESVLEEGDGSTIITVVAAVNLATIFTYHNESKKTTTKNAK